MNPLRIALAVAALSMTQAPVRPPRIENGVVTGQLRGLNGAPAAGVRVTAMALPASGQGEGALMSLAETDSAGRYRLENILPGRYYIQAGFLDAPNYYPGVSSIANAATVLVNAGATVIGVDFMLARSAGARVSGRVPLTINPKPASIRLMAGPGLPGVMSSRSPGSDGSFEFLRVAPGNYTIVATPANALLPNVPVLVVDKDINIGFPEGPGVKVSGVVGLGANSPRPQTQRVVLTGSTAWTQLEAPINAAGEFEFPNVPAGSYSVRTVPGSSLELSRLAVADREIRGLVVPAFVELGGRVALDDGGTLPSSRTALMIEARGVNGNPVATAADRDGAFRLPLSEGEYQIAVGKLPPDVLVKSMSYGSSDILVSPLKLDGAAAPMEIRLILQKK